MGILKFISTINSCFHATQKRKHLKRSGVNNLSLKEKHIVIISLLVLCVLYMYFVLINKVNNANLDKANILTSYKKVSLELDSVKAQLDSLYGVTKDFLPNGMTSTYIGEFLCTAYCTEEYPHICGTGDGITASGEKVKAGITVAVDTSIIPLGTIIYIEGVGIRIAQDTGGSVKENKIDVAVETHQDALSWSGYGYHKVYILGG